jgi:Tfp pilus assembly protein PilO
MNRNITALILIALAIGIFFTFTQAQIDKDKLILAVNGQYESAIVNAKALASIRDKVLKDSQQIAIEDRVRLDKMIPSSVDNIHLIVDLSRLAQSKGLSLKNLKAELVDNNLGSNGPTMASAGDSNGSLLPNLTLANIKVSFDVTAPYKGFIDLIQSLESDLRIMDITNLSIKATDTGVYDFSVGINTYWLRQ